MTTQRGTLSADHKIPGGKLLRVRLTLGGPAGSPTIQSIHITGDFFMHPEEAIESLEAMLTGAPFAEDAVRERVRSFFSGEVEVIGADVEGVVTAIMKVS